jgi:hypothetical protein
MDMTMDTAPQRSIDGILTGLQRSYASDYLGLGILITGYILVRLPLGPSPPRPTVQPTN